MGKARHTLDSFTVDTLPSLDVVVEGALELVAEESVPQWSLNLKRPLVIGSAGSLAAGRILFAGTDAQFANESNYQLYLNHSENYDAVVLVSASGSKHAIVIGEAIKNSRLPGYLLTNNTQAPAAVSFDSNNVLYFPKNREPYTYNTSTYLSMILSKTGGNAAVILDFLHQHVKPTIHRDLSCYGSHVFILPPAFAEVCPLIRIKFEEMFMPHVLGRAYTSEEIKHAKTVITSGDELYIAIGAQNTDYGVAKNRVTVPLPDGACYAAAVAVSYYVIGLIQNAHPPYFKDSIVAYTETASRLFGQRINPIVE